MGEYYPYHYEQYSWTPNHGYPMQTTLPFGQGIYPDQFQSYYNAGYQLQQEDAATNPFVPNMPQQMAPVQTGYYTDPDGSMDHQYGEVVDQHGLFTVDYSVQGGVEQYYTDPMTSMDYYQYPPIPTIDNYGYYNSFNEMYNSQQSYYTMEDYSGGPMRISRHQYHESNVQPYSVPQQPASTRCNTSTAKNTGESSQETVTLTAISRLLAEAEDLKSAIQRGELQIENQTEILSGEKRPRNNQSCKAAKQHSCNVPAPAQSTATNSKTEADTSTEVNDGKLPSKELKTVTIEELLAVDPVEADALLDGLERRIESICASEQQDHESTFRNEVKKALESEEFSDLWEIMEEGTAASKVQVCQPVPKSAEEVVKAPHTYENVPKAKGRSLAVGPNLEKIPSVQSEQSKVVEVITVNDSVPTNVMSHSQSISNGVTVTSAPRKKTSLDLSYLDFIPLEDYRPTPQAPGASAKPIHKKPGLKPTHTANKNHSGTLTQPLKLLGVSTSRCHGSESQSHFQSTDRDEVFRAEGLDSVFVELRSTGNDVIVDPETQDTPRMHKKGRKRCNDDKDNYSSAKRFKVSAGTWLGCSSSSSTDDDVIFMGVRRCNTTRGHTGVKWCPGFK